MTRPHRLSQSPPAAASLSLRDGSPLRANSLDAHGPAAVWTLSDGSRLLFAPGTRWEPLSSSSAEFVSSVRAGVTTFDVKPGGPRRWIVEAGPISVEVVGTRFVVSRDETNVAVTVERGAVLVRGKAVPDNVQRLVAGQHLTVRLSVDAPPTASAAAEPPEMRASVASSGRAQQEAPSALPSSPTTEQREGIERLLALSDVARRSGHPEAAVAPLQSIIDQHAGTPEAALAAVTLGRLLLDQLAQPREAARALERALALGASRGLREDIYARLFEAYERVGDRTAAERAMENYEREFPNGRKAR
ncbi:MAG TPA: FecR domain-containing protein [Polyangiaceae bacterium]|nr:FecR domain-containing protein [Polyangiaceae bacterium]